MLGLLSVKGWIIFAGVLAIAYSGFQVSNLYWKNKAEKEKVIFTKDQEGKINAQGKEVSAETAKVISKDNELDKQVKQLEKERDTNDATSKRPVLSSDWLRELSKLR